MIMDSEKLVKNPRQVKATWDGLKVYSRKSIRKPNGQFIEDVWTPESCHPYDDYPFSYFWAFSSGRFESPSIEFLNIDDNSEALTLFEARATGKELTSSARIAAMGAINLMQQGLSSDKALEKTFEPFEEKNIQKTRESYKRYYYSTFLVEGINLEYLERMLDFYFSESGIRSLKKMVTDLVRSLENPEQESL